MNKNKKATRVYVNAVVSANALLDTLVGGGELRRGLSEDELDRASISAGLAATLLHCAQVCNLLATRAAAERV